MEKLEMTEVAPAKPDVKPKPKREAPPKPRPNKDDPWTVPGPKVNPTPKAQKNIMTKKKMLITSKNDFEALKKIVTKDTFYKKFDVAMDVVAEVTAEDAMVKLYFEDNRMLTTDEKSEMKMMNSAALKKLASTACDF